MRGHRVFDPLHGYIHLTDAEFRLIRSPLFQRLNLIRQLGFVNVMFPSATHTRLGHSLGVLHMAQRMIDAVNMNEYEDMRGPILSGKDQALIRFAALLHDVGHLPFSHIGEVAYADALRAEQASNVDTSQADGAVQFKNAVDIGLKPKDLHEQISSRIIRADREIAEAFKEYNSEAIPAEKIDPNEVAQLIDDSYAEKDKAYLKAFIHSAVDADRLDFLYRDSYFVGSNYGRVETDTILRKLRLVEIEHKWYELCLDSDASLVADHFLISRFYWYAVLLGHPRILYLDSLVKDVMRFLLREKDIPSIYELDTLTANIHDKNNMHRFMELQDSKVITLMRERHRKWDGDSSITEEERRLDSSIKVLMGGNLSHMFCDSQCFMENEKYEEIFEADRIANLEKKALCSLREKRLIDQNWAFVKCVHKARPLHKWAPDCKGTKFDDAWHDHVLMKCKKEGHPKCVPLQLADTKAHLKIS